MLPKGHVQTRENEVLQTGSQICQLHFKWHFSLDGYVLDLVYRNNNTSCDLFHLFLSPINFFTKGNKLLIGYLKQLTMLLTPPLNFVVPNLEFPCLNWNFSQDLTNESSVFVLIFPQFCFLLSLYYYILMLITVKVFIF